MAGAGDLVGPGEDARAMERRAAAFAAEMTATGEVARTLVRRAAVLAVRLERAGERQAVAEAAHVAAAVAGFDEQLADDLAGPIARFEGGGDPAAASRELEATPDGVAYLIASWRQIAAWLGADDAVVVDHARAEATRRLGTGADAAGDLPAEVAAEVARLAGVAAGLAADAAALVAARDEVAILARFDPAPEANLARRYEAAAERGMYRALHAVGAIPRPRKRASEPGREETPPPPTPAEAPARAPIVAAIAAARGAVGSFSAGVERPIAPAPRPLIDPTEPPPFPTPRRQPRPDLSKKGRRRR